MALSGRKDGQSERLERVAGEVLEAFRASEAEINTVAASRDLFKRVQARIAAEQERREQAPFITASRSEILSPRLSWRACFGLPPMGWSLAAAAVGLLLLIVLTVPRWLSNAHSENAKVTPPAVTPSPAPTAASTPNRPTPAPVAAEGSQVRSEVNQPEIRNERSQPANPRHPVRYRVAEPDESEEVATNYLPLTPTADAEGMSGQVVRIQLPRSALAQFGVAVTPERADELVKADVVLGDDGLARAIRLIQQR